MKSSIEEFVERQLACELLPTDMTFVCKAMLPPKPGCQYGSFKATRVGFAEFAGLRVCWCLRRESGKSCEALYPGQTSHNPDPLNPNPKPRP